MQTSFRKLCANFVKLLKEVLISSFLLSKKNLWLGILLFFVVSEIFLPLHHADAVLGILGGIADGIGKAIGAVIAGFLTAIPAAIFGTAALILQWTIDPKFINVPSYTKGAIVDIGWPIVRDIANMGIVMALVVIGLATALRLEEYQARKTLPRLILVALLINFTPVILGAIVDATNILMYFFLDGLAGIDAITRVFASIHSVVVSDLGNFNFFNPLQQQLFMFKIMAIWIFYTLAAIIFYLFAFLFIARRIVIWMLVIFSPLAFVAWILPGTRRYWSMWWNQFLQWSIIGVFAAFFLYLGDHMIGMAASGNFTGSAPEGFGGWIVRPAITMLEQMMPYVVALLFLLFGFFVALTTSAFGSAATLNFAKKAYAGAGKFVGGQTAGRFLATETGKKWAERLESTGLLTPSRQALEKFREAKGLEKIARGAGLVAGTLALPVTYPTRWGVRQGARVALEYGAKQPQEIEGEIKEYEKRFGKDIARAAATYESLSTADWQKKVALGLYLVKTKGAKGLGTLSEDQIREVVQLTSKYNPARLEDIVKHRPELIAGQIGEKEGIPVIDGRVSSIVQEVMVRKRWQDDDVKELIRMGVEPADAIRKAAFKKAVDALKGDDIEALAKATLDNSEFQEMVARFKPWNFIRRIGEEKGLGYLDRLQEKAQSMGIKEIAESNPTFLRAAYTPAGEMFLRHWEEGGREISDKGEIDEIIKNVPRPLRPESEVDKIIRRAEEEEKGREGVIERKKAEEDYRRRFMGRGK